MQDSQSTLEPNKDNPLSTDTHDATLDAPLSEGQKGMWLFHKLDLRAGVSQNLPFCLSLKKKTRHPSP